MSTILSSTTYKLITSCRICLCSKPRKDITELKIPDTKESHIAILLYCLDLKIKEESTIATKLCSKCYKKIIDYYQFKTLAHKSDVRIRSLAADLPENAVFLNDNIKVEEISDTEVDHIRTEEITFAIKEECKDEESEDELLSAINKIKYEVNNDDDTKENEETPHEDQTEIPIPIKKKRGRPKTLDGPIKKSQLSKHVCEECGKEVKNLRAHSRVHQSEVQRKTVKCEICDKVYLCVRTKNKHVKRKHLTERKACELCDKKVLNIAMHMQTTHNRDTLPFECETCGRKFLTRGMLKSHMTIHTKIRPFECEQCGKRFRLRITLVSHQRQVHEGEKSHLCQFCSKSFFKKHHLQLHLRSHTKEKPYKCEECGRCFSSSSILKNHKTVHSDVKNYKCTLCDMSFARSNYLSAHMTSHLKLKRYPCQYCGLKFHRSDHRKRHEFTSHLKHLADKES